MRMQRRRSLAADILRTHREGLLGLAEQLRVQVCVRVCVCVCVCARVCWWWWGG